MSNIVNPLDGISGELAGSRYGFRATLLFFISISIYNVIELVILVLSTFRRWRGLYFWSLMLSGCLGVVPYSLGFMLKFFTHASSFLSVTMLTIGWWTMVTGQSFVLYSRLHLVIRDERILRRVLCMIIVNIFLLHVPTSVLTYGSNVAGQSLVFIKGYNIMEKIQMTGFTVQEVILSGLYIWETTKLLRLGSNRHNRKIMHQLVGINISMFVIDLVLLALEYANLYAIQITLKGVIYSIKLKLEFAVLGKLVDMVQIHRGTATLENDVRLYSLDCERGRTAPTPSPGMPGSINFSGFVQAGTKRSHILEKEFCSDRNEFTMTKVSALVSDGHLMI
ncbi:hypothetical protein BDV29DRAFT_199918 [Aspergillus leporis]|uniref:DUF7703 domain-containing protein n=1 Tax=Aspergillus leporis TaxID=41062 RepID=A0A5N5XIH7_9EURO|nr:hypothetical protein BDV29DRAFT_199918 [Aspergillus leporis]